MNKILIIIGIILIFTASCSIFDFINPTGSFSVKMISDNKMELVINAEDNNKIDKIKFLINNIKRKEYYKSEIVDTLSDLVTVDKFGISNYAIRIYDVNGNSTRIDYLFADSLKPQVDLKMRAISVDSVAINITSAENESLAYMELTSEGSLVKSYDHQSDVKDTIQCSIYRLASISFELEVYDESGNRSIIKNTKDGQLPTGSLEITPISSSEAEVKITASDNEEVVIIDIKEDQDVIKSYEYVTEVTDTLSLFINKNNNYINEQIMNNGLYFIQHSIIIYDNSGNYREIINSDHLMIDTLVSVGNYEYLHTKSGILLNLIRSGTFTMGSNSEDEDIDNDEVPQHDVYLDQYYMSKYEITNAQYKLFCDQTGRNYPSDPGYEGMSDYFNSYPNYPVVNVTWNDAKAYCDWAGFELPSEAQWEKGARGPYGKKYPWGYHDPHYNYYYYANYSPVYAQDADGFYYTGAVGSYPEGKSPYALMDMGGNVWEWCADWYDSTYYSRSPSNNPPGPQEGVYRVIRGGSWNDEDTQLRCANRYKNEPASEKNNIGFRPICY